MIPDPQALLDQVLKAEAQVEANVGWVDAPPTLMGLFGGEDGEYGHAQVMGPGRWPGNQPLLDVLDKLAESFVFGERNPAVAASLDMLGLPAFAGFVMVAEAFENLTVTPRQFEDYVGEQQRLAEAGQPPTNLGKLAGTREIRTALAVDTAGRWYCTRRPRGGQAQGEWGEQAGPVQVYNPFRAALHLAVMGVTDRMPSNSYTITVLRELPEGQWREPNVFVAVAEEARAALAATRGQHPPSPAAASR